MTVSNDPKLLGSWTSKFDKITLYEEEGSLKAEVENNHNEKWTFLDKQVACGILGSLSSSQIIERIGQIGKEKVAVCAYPKESPTEVWAFEAEKLAVADIKRGKESLKQGDNKKALEKFETALKIQKLKNGSTSDLEKAIEEIKGSLSFERFKELPTLYLPKKENTKAFEEIIETYQDEENIFESFETLLLVEASPSAHHHLMAAMVSENKEEYAQAAQSYLVLAESDNPNAMACIEKAYSLIEKAPTQDPNLSLRKHAVRICFEKYLLALSQKSPQKQAPTCFICFNVSEKDVGKWLENTLVPDLDHADIKPIFCFEELSQGQDLDHFQEIARHADQVIIACTPDLKAKYEERKKAPVGLAQEIRMIKGRYNDEDKAHTISPIYLKGTRKEALPTAYFEPIFGAKFAPFKGDASDIDYFSNAFDLFCSMREIPRGEARKLKEAFFQEAREILTGKVNEAQVIDWKAKHEEKQRALFDSIAERISNRTQMMNCPLPVENFTGRQTELEKLHKACKHKHRVAISGLGGVGKTSLALQYANDYKASYQWAYFILATTADTMTTGLLKLADDLHVSKSEKRYNRKLCLRKKERTLGKT